MQGWVHVRSWLAQARELRPRTVLTIGYVALLVYGFPGYMSTDSVVQLVEARKLRFTDGHPPLMAAEWAVLEKFFTGPILMLLLQGALFLGGLYLLFQRIVRPNAAAWLATAVLVFPPVLLPMAVIWKDSQMAAYLVMGAALLLHPRLRLRIVGLVCLFVACALRHNAFAAVVPLVFCLFEWRAGIRWWKRIVVVGGATVLLLAAAYGVSRLLTSQHIKLTPVFQDIVGVMARTDEKPDAQWVEILRGTPLVGTTEIQERARKLHAKNGAYHIVQGQNRLFDNPSTPEHWDALSRVWKELVLEDPGAYLLSHWDKLAVLLGLGLDPIAPHPVWNLFLEDNDTILEINHGATWSRLQYQLGEGFKWLHEHTSLFAPYIYALLALILLAVCARDRVTIAFFTSGLLYELSFFPVGANPDYRYSHWMITSCCIAIAILFIHRRRESTT
jgi:hypothetical protein